MSLQQARAVLSCSGVRYRTESLYGKHKRFLGYSAIQRNIIDKPQQPVAYTGAHDEVLEVDQVCTHKPLMLTRCGLERELRQQTDPALLSLQKDIALHCSLTRISPSLSYDVSMSAVSRTDFSASFDTFSA